MKKLEIKVYQLDDEKLEAIRTVVNDMLVHIGEVSEGCYVSFVYMDDDGTEITDILREQHEFDASGEGSRQERLQV